MSEIVGDFPLVHPAMYGKQTRYAYIAVTDTHDSAAQFKVSSGAWLRQVESFGGAINPVAARQAAAAVPLGIGMHQPPP